MYAIPYEILNAAYEILSDHNARLVECVYSSKIQLQRKKTTSQNRMCKEFVAVILLTCLIIVLLVITNLHKI